MLFSVRLQAQSERHKKDWYIPEEHIHLAEIKGDYHKEHERNDRGRLLMHLKQQ